MINRLALVLITLFLLGRSGMEAQNAPTKAKEALFLLKESVLIVRIPSNQNKVDALSEIVENSTLSDADRQKADIRLQSTQKETEAEALIIKSTFSNYFGFTNLLFMYDKDSDRLAEGQRNGFFLDENLQTSSSINLNTDDFFILDIGYTDPSNSSRTYALIIKDQEFNTLASPFPYAQRINTTGLIIDQLSGKNNFQKYFKKAVIKLDKKLNRYFGKLEKP